MNGLPPGSVIGILGGGQLGRMTALAAYPLGYQVHIFSPEEGPATQVTPLRTLASLSTLSLLHALARPLTNQAVLDQQMP